MQICVRRIQVRLPSHPSLLLHPEISTLVLLKKLPFGKLFPNEK